METKLLHVASSPHAKGNLTTSGIMRDVIIALIPALVVAVVFFGPRVISLTLFNVVLCCFFEWGYRKLMKKSFTLNDGSACVTAILLTMCLPVSIPYWCCIVGDFFAIVVVKQLFGGLGKNFMNPALAARCFMFSFATLMTTWTGTGVSNWLGIFTTSSAVDAVSTATPLHYLHTGDLAAAMDKFSYMDMLIGNHGSSLGEMPILMLLIGFVYLLVRKVITPRIPLIYVGTVALLTFLFPLAGAGGDRLDWMLYNILGGGLILGAVFMATDYVTSPVTPLGQTIYAIGCGLICVLIRYFGNYPEGVSFSIIFMNCFVWMFDKWGAPKRFGFVKPEKVKKEAASK